MKKKLLLFFIVIFSLGKCFNLYGNDFKSSLVIVYDSSSESSIEPGSFNIKVLLKIDDNKYYEILTTNNYLEYFNYQGIIRAENGGDYYLFRDFSLPAGLARYYYVDLSRYTAYITDSLDETEYIQILSVNALMQTVGILSIDIKDCGNLYQKALHKIWDMKKLEVNVLFELPENYTIIHQINICKI